MANSRTGTRASLWAMGILLAAALCFAIWENGRAETLSGMVDAGYRRAMYESAELLGGLEGSLRKLPASASAAQEQTLLAEIAQQAFGIQQNLASLPYDAGDLEGALKFVNQTRDYALTLIDRLADGGALGENDRSQLESLAGSSRTLQQQLLSGAETLSPLTFDDTPDTGNNTSTPSVQYPSLIYDGPFSDGTKEQVMLALGDSRLEVDQAEAVLRTYIGEDRIRSIQYIGEILLPTECYEFNVQTEYESMTACVTIQGGRVLYILSDPGSGRETLSEGECIDSGARFLSSREYGDMQPTYWSRENGTLTVNYAAVQDGVLLYPDLVKLRISMDTGLVTGVESRNYLTNHVLRTFPAEHIDAEDARSRVSERISVSGSRLCVIPTDSGEAFAWEVSGDIEGIGSYLIYLNAVSGIELDILRLVQTESGLETQ